MCDSGFTPGTVLLDFRQQPFAVRLENACSSKLKELHQNPTSCAPICRVVRKEHKHGRTTDGMNWPAAGEKSVLRTTILDTTAAKIAAQHWAREKEAKIRAGVRMWWTDGSRWEDGQVGAAAVCKHGNEWRSHHSLLGTRRMEVFEAVLCLLGLALNVASEKRETLQEHGVKTVAVFSDPPATIRCMAHLSWAWGNHWERQLTEGCGVSLPMALQPRSIGSRDTPASPQTKKQTVRRTWPEMQVEARW